MLTVWLLFVVLQSGKTEIEIYRAQIDCITEMGIQRQKGNLAYCTEKQVK